MSSKRRRKKKAKPRRTPGERYDTHAYQNAIRYACKQAGVPTWTPNRLRHNARHRRRSVNAQRRKRLQIGLNSRSAAVV